MSKYNRIVSIPIERIPKRRIKKAIHQWAEGDAAMERLLLACYDRGIRTSGCHAGARPWISFNYQDNLERLIPLFEITQKEIGSQLLISIDGGNPFSGPDWYKPSLLIGTNFEYKDEADIYFDKLTSILDETNNKNNHFMLRLLEFFIGKESALLLRFKHNEDKFVFYIESREIPNDRYEYYNQIFTKAGLTEVVNAEGFPPTMHAWKIESDKLDDILLKLDSITNYIIDNYSFDVPKSDDEIINFISRTRFKKKTLSEKEFNKWLKKEKKRLFKFK